MGTKTKSVEGEIVAKHPGGRPLLYKTPEDMERVIDAYFADCVQRDVPFTISGLADELDMDRKTLLNYSKRDKFLPTIKRAKRKVERHLEERMLASNGIVAGVIFNAKNNFGWVDKQEIDNKHEIVQPIVGGLAKKQLDDEQDRIDDGE